VDETETSPFTGFGLVIAGIAAWTSVFVAASACAVELSLSYAVSSGTYGIASTIAIPAMLGYHALIGVGEAAITVGVVTYLWKVSPGAFARPVTEKPAAGLARVVYSRTVQAAIAVLVVFALALPLYFVYSSEGEDGLERTMSDAGEEEGEPLLSAPLDYGEDYIAALLAGMFGFVATSLAALGVLAVLRSRASRAG
jgi:cobalt/nickel transport system permease protein